MSSSQQKPWSDNPNAPKIPYVLYSEEKASFAGTSIGSILYGVVVVLFLQCMTAMFHPVHRRGQGIKWGLALYTAVIFSSVTALTGIQLYIQSVSYIDNHEFPGIGSRVPPGPLGYRSFICTGVLGIIPNVMFNLNNWLASGLLLHRCFMIYAKNLWVIAFPCLMYLGSLATGIMFLYQTSGTDWGTVPIGFVLPYFSISLALDVLLTLMIVARLIRYIGNIRTAMGRTEIGGLCKAIVITFIESSALYAASSLLVVGRSNVGTTVVLLPILAETQVIALLLIIQQSVSKSALTRNTVASAHISEFRAGSRRRSAGDDPLPGGFAMGFVNERRTNSGELRVEIETTIDVHRDGV